MSLRPACGIHARPKRGEVYSHRGLLTGNVSAHTWDKSKWHLPSFHHPLDKSHVLESNKEGEAASSLALECDQFLSTLAVPPSFPKIKQASEADSALPDRHGLTPSFNASLRPICERSDHKRCIGHNAISPMGRAYRPTSSPGGGPFLGLRCCKRVFPSCQDICPTNWLSSIH